MKKINTFKGRQYFVKMLCLVGLLGLGCKGDPISPDNEEEDNDLVYIDKSCSSCDFVITSDQTGFDGIAKGVEPGDTIGIASGTRGSLYLSNIIGTEDKPVVIMNCDGHVESGTSKDEGYGISIIESEHFIITGTGDTNSKYGIGLRGYMGMALQGKSTNFEVEAVEVLETGYAGIIARSDPTCDGEISRSTFTQYNTIIHDNYVHNTGGEGIYIGGSHWSEGWDGDAGCPGTVLSEPELKGVRVYNNIINNTGRDGFQVGSAVEDCELHHNSVSNYGLAGDYGHLNGIQLGPGTTGTVYNNVVVDGGGGYGIAIFGRGDVTAFNNLIINPGAGIGTFMRDPTPGLGFYVMNNTIINPKEDGVAIFDNETVGTVFFNNIIVNPVGEFFISYVGQIEIDSANNYLTYDINELMFKDIANLDYSLKDGSPAIDAGKDVSSYHIDFDITGAKRPVNEYDIGAYEKQ